MVSTEMAGLALRYSFTTISLEAKSQSELITKNELLKTGSHVAYTDLCRPGLMSIPSFLIPWVGYSQRCTTIQLEANHS